MLIKIVIIIFIDKSF